MSKPTVATRFWFGDRVHLALAPDIEVMVVGMSLTPGNVEYQCAWIAGGKREQECFTASELVGPAAIIGQIGFGGREERTA